MAILYPGASWIGPVHPENFMVGRNGTPISEIVEHHTACSLLAAEQTFWAAPASGRAHSAHLIFDRDGAIYQCVYLDDTAYGAGDWPANLRGIQKEHVSGFPADPDYDQFTDVQYHESIRFNQWACAEFGFPEDPDHDRPHNFYTQTACPGALDINRIIAGDPMALYDNALAHALGVNPDGSSAGDTLGAGWLIGLYRAIGPDFAAVQAAIADVKAHIGTGGPVDLSGLSAKLDALAVTVSHINSKFAP